MKGSLTPDFFAFAASAASASTSSELHARELQNGGSTRQRAAPWPVLRRQLCHGHFGHLGAHVHVHGRLLLRKTRRCGGAGGARRCLFFKPRCHCRLRGGAATPDAARVLARGGVGRERNVRHGVTAMGAPLPSSSQWRTESAVFPRRRPRPTGTRNRRSAHPLTLAASGSEHGLRSSEQSPRSVTRACCRCSAPTRPSSHSAPWPLAPSMLDRKERRAFAPSDIVRTLASPRTAWARVLTALRAARRNWQTCPASGTPDAARAKATARPIV